MLFFPKRSVKIRINAQFLWLGNKFTSIALSVYWQQRRCLTFTFCAQNSTIHNVYVSVPKRLSVHGEVLVLPHAQQRNIHINIVFVPTVGIVAVCEPKMCGFVYKNKFEFKITYSFSHTHVHTNNKLKDKVRTHNYFYLFAFILLFSLTLFPAV